MMKNVWFLFLIISLNSFAQSNVKSFFELSSPERWWVVFHPFKAKNAFIVSKDAIHITDSIAKTKILGNDKNGGQIDAFKHSFWMARLTQKIKYRPAIKLGEAHEKGNYKTFKKNQLEDGYVPDKISSEMDLHNNKIGAQIAIDSNELKREEIINVIIEEIQKGEMKILKKDSLGNFLTCEGIIIPIDSLKGKWENKKCLVSSNKK